MEKESLTFENTLWVINLHKKFPSTSYCRYIMLTSEFASKIDNYEMGK